MIVEIANLQKHYRIDSRKVKRAVREALSGSGRDARLSIAFVDNNEIKKLNKRYLESSEVTDVIAFPLGNNGNLLNGEIVVSVETAVDTAGKRRTAIEGEVILYVIHGILHLLGYDDGDEGDAGVMHEEESRILKNLGYYNVPKVKDGFL